MIDYRILPAQRLIVISDSGKTAMDDILKFRARLLADPDFSPAYDGVMDVTYQESQFTGQEMRRLAESGGETDRPACKLAFIAPSDLVYGMSRMNELLTQHSSAVEKRVFRDAPSALAWLGREDLDIGKILAEIRGGDDLIDKGIPDVA